MLIYNTSTTSKRSLWPLEAADLWVVEAEDSLLTLNNGRVYDDWASALGANTLGYDRFVTERFFDSPADRFYPATSLPWQIEHDFAEEFCEAMGTGAVRFFKSGSDAVSCAVRLARAFTGKDEIVIFKECYHGTAGEFKPIAWNKAGYPNTPAIALPFGKELTSAVYLSAAAIVVEPVPKAILLPPNGWLQHLREVCDAHGILLISDEIILGYRHSLRGYLRSAGIVPDLACYGKAMAQGAALSACTGRYDIMKQLIDIVHFSGTNNGEPLPLQIAQWTLREYQEKGICDLLAAKGRTLRDCLLSVKFETKGLDSRFEVVFDTDEAKKSAIKYCFDHGILFPGWCSLAISHTMEQKQQLVETLTTWRNMQ